MATIKDLKRWYDSTKHCRTGYCCEYTATTPKHELITLGYNAGVYGWNWTVYLEASTDTLYISYYRNVPNYIKEK